MTAPPHLDIPFHRGLHGDRDAAAVREVLRSGHTGGGGAISERVEARLRTVLASRHALLVTSCTHAMEACVMAMGVGPGDEVIVPGFLYVSLAAAVARQGARPVFVDVEPVRLGLDPARVEEAIGPRTRAIFAVHYGGVPCRIDELLEIGARRGIPVLEDAAQAIGSLGSGGRPLGSLGLAGCLSFHESKNVSCGEGGAIVTSDETLARRIETIRDKGTNRAAAVRGEIPHYTWVSAGSSFTLSEIAAAVLETQLAELEHITRDRQRLMRRYAERLAPLAARFDLVLPAPPAEGERWNGHIFALLLPARIDRDAVVRAVRARGVQLAAHFQTLHDSPFMRSAWPGEPPALPVTARICAGIVRLPIYPSLTGAELDRVVDALEQALAAADPR